MLHLTRRGLATLAAGAASIALTRPGHADQTTITLPFVIHASFFSAESHQPKSLDPHAFAADPAAPAAIGPQNIPHAAGFRPAFIADPGTTPVNNPQGKPLGFTLAEWFAATGTVRITQTASGVTATCSFAKLRPHGTYSLFENHFDLQPVGFTPLDGSGKANSFTADAEGNATITMPMAAMLTHANAVLLVFHSDGQAHGTQRGDIGVNAHHQLIARIPN